MNCPLCAKLNLNYKIITFGGICVCENDVCIFCESEESFMVASIENNVPSLKCEYTPQLIKNDNLSTTCNNSIENVNDLLKYENRDVKNLPKPMEINSKSIDNYRMITDENVTQSIKDQINTDQCESNVKTNEDVEIMDLSDEFNILSEQEKKSKDKLTKTRSLKSVNEKDNVYYPRSISIDPVICADLEASFYHYNNKLFNWLRMPYLMKTHSKIVRILLLHLDIFKFKDSTDIIDVKREYGVYETLANQFKIDAVRHHCYRFLDKLYNIIDKIPDKSLINKEMDERVVCLLNKLFEKYDLSSSLKFEYKTELCCSNCGFEKMIESKDYMLSIERNKFQLKIQENKFVYSTNCLKCSKKLTKTVSFKRVPEFVIFHCPKGLKEDISKYENKIVTSDGRKLSVVAVIESGSKYPFVEYPENQMSWLSYDKCDTIMDTRCRPSYCVHFRNKYGWFSLNGYKQFLCSPQDALSIYSESDIRFVVCGEVSDPRIYRYQFSIQDLITKYEEDFKNLMTEIITKSNIDLHNKTVIQKPSKKNCKAKKLKPKKKKKKWVETEENIRQLPRVSNENNDIIINSGNFTVSTKENSSNHQILTRNIELRNNDHGNNSSSESSKSSIIDNDGFSPVKKKRNNNEILSQSTSSLSSNFSRVLFKSKRQKEVFSIDDLITQQRKKRNQSLR